MYNSILFLLVAEQKVARKYYGQVNGVNGVSGKGPISLLATTKLSSSPTVGLTVDKLSSSPTGRFNAICVLPEVTSLSKVDSFSNTVFVSEQEVQRI